MVPPAVNPLETGRVLIHYPEMQISEAEFRATQLAGKQGGYIVRRQALACGMSPAQIRNRLQSKRWSSTKPGLYLVLGFPPSTRGRLLAATAMLGAVASHQTAAELHDLPGPDRGLVVVTVPIRTTNRFLDVIVHQSTDLTKDQVVDIDEVPCTDLIRTVIDNASYLKPVAVGRMIDRVVIDGRTTLEAIAERVDLLCRRGKPGTRTMQRALEPRLGETLIGESEIEALALRLFVEWGLPPPILQMALPWRSPRKGRVDFCFPEAKLIVEIDGRAWHATLDAFEGDRMRDNHAQLAGWRVLRITYRMLKERPDEVRDMIRRALLMAAV